MFSLAELKRAFNIFPKAQWRHVSGRILLESNNDARTSLLWGINYILDVVARADGYENDEDFEN
jgi:hypothetical protein